MSEESSKKSTQDSTTQDPQTEASETQPIDKDRDSWPLQADRMAIRMPLVDCLRMLAGHYGRRTSNDGLTAGLPIPTKGLTPSLFIRAAERADMQAHLAERSLDSLAIAPNLPCIMALEEGQACILWDIQYPEKHPPKKEIGEGGTQGDIVIHPETIPSG